jgi:hypothetical protein
MITKTLEEKPRVAFIDDFQMVNVAVLNDGKIEL